jgi:arylsulfatase
VPSFATNVDDPTQVGKQRIEDAGTLYPNRMETVDDEILDFALKFMDRAQGRRQALLRVAQPNAHAHRYSPVSQIRGDAQQLDDIVGSVMQKLKDLGVDDNTIVCSPPTTAPKSSRGPTTGE